MLCMLVAYDAAGDVIATLDHMVASDADDNVIGLIDFEAHEAAGGALTDIWTVQDAAGSGTWPEWLSAGAHDFRIELEPGWSSRALQGPPHRIRALVHKTSGHRRERAEVEAAIAARIVAAEGEPADIRDLVGGPDRPLLLDDAGRTKARVPAKRPDLPLVLAEPREAE